MNENTLKNTETPSEANLSDINNQELASRGSRLGASIIDTIIMMLFAVPAMYLTGGFDGISEGAEPSLVYSIMMGIFGIIVFLLINFKLLKERGQTVGKKVVRIKIVDLEGNQAILGQHLIKRYAIFFIPGQVPVVGQVFSIVNALFIFGKEKRCIHDYVAKTRVVDC